MTDATKAGLAIMVTLAVAALIGTRLLHLFGVSLDAFMVAGGLVLAWMGLTILRGQADASASSTGPSDSDPSLTALILFAASPGTITGVITLSAAHTWLKLPITALVAIAVAIVLTWLVMLLAGRVAGAPDGGGLIRGMVSRLMGLIVLATGVQFALTGFHAFGS